MNKLQKVNIDQIASCLLEGGVVVVPTDTVYGLAASPLHTKAVDRIFKLKSRPSNRNLPIMVADANYLIDMGLELNDHAKKLLASSFVPGELTLVLGFKNKPLVDWLEGREEVAIRIPNHELLLEILKKTGPLLVTSANKHGVKETPIDTNEILEQLNGQPEMVIEGDVKLELAPPSTIVNCRTEPPKIERQGRITEAEIFKILNDE